MDLGVQIEPQFGFGFEELVRIAEDAERAGFTRYWVSDHLFLDEDAVATDCLEAWTLLAALALRTRSVRIGPMVTAQSYRNPALLAKIAAGVDVMSGGRLEFGIGAGWKEVEYRAYGFEYPPDGARVTQMVEALEICRRMWTEARATFHGKHYRIDGALCSPKPVQRPLPVWIGGKMPRIMRAAARSAQWFNLGGGVGARGPQAVAAAMRQLDEICRAVKRDPRTLGRSVFLGATVAKARKRSDELIGQLAAENGPGWLDVRPGYVAGTPEDALAKLRTLAALGIAHVNLQFQPHGTEREQIAALAEIVPALR
jgi:alkanesulfonate monooxygenase SsuD/methylene tetrahydromethanopterin reductase-like flavin-dependent oxidoreductase (luciferase family)